MTNTNMQTNKTFEQKLKDRVRDSIGELLSDEELSKIVSKGIEETFFKPKLKSDNYSMHTKYDDPLIVNILKDLVKDRVYEQVDLWIKENPDKVQLEINKVVENGVGNAVINAISNKFNFDLMSFQSDIENKLKSSIL